MSGPPPVPTKKAKRPYNTGRHNKRNEEKEENYENIRFSVNAKDAEEKYRTMQNAGDKYKKQNEELEKETKQLQLQVSEAETNNGSLQNSLHELNLRFESEKNRWQRRSNESDIEIQNLKKQLVDLEKETRKYQDALGKAKNFHFGDDSNSNTVELAKTISGIVVLLEEFTSVKGKDVSINENAANELLLHYKCAMRVGEGKGKPVLSAALQRLILEEIFRFINEYLFQPKLEIQQQSSLSLQSSDQQSEHPQPQQPKQLPQLPQQPQQSQQQQPQEVDKQDPEKKARAAIAIGRSQSLTRPSLPPILGQEPTVEQEQTIEFVDDNNLEAEITSCMKVLCDLVQQLSESREGTDDITRVTPINIRQQVYSVLGTRGFCNDKHPFIDQLTDTILKTVGKYRQFKNNDKQTESHERAEKIARNFAPLYFRLIAQEPVPEFTEFFEAGTPLQVNIMEGTWDDHEIHDLEVEICSFPLVSVKGKDDARKVLYKSVVLTRTKNG
ncbi:21199_t:CDS:2 [Dentiscutata erythropus]|uniref:21199_t:CDS:1 n=1 Tax=Dentiscutata erythropus TaxID=1348616 RepID=A0A9N9D997_9GLOM|nr:21199_t:CDS:2 [Dentiscutata erythropus]